MPPLHEAIDALRKHAQQYSTAVLAESRSNHSGILSTAFRIGRARAKYGVGPLYYSLYRLGRIPESEWSEYLTDGPAFKKAVREMSPVEMQRLMNNKALLYEHCLRIGCATAPILCVIGTSPDRLERTTPFVRTIEQWFAALGPDPPAMFVKTIAGTYGIGSFTICRTTAGDYEFDGKSGTLDDAYRHIESKLRQEGGGWIVQPRLRSHAALLTLVSQNGLATARVVTAMNKGVASLVIACFKITVGANITDNFAKGASGNLLASVDLSTGRLSDAWGTCRTDWPEIARFERHPESQQQIGGFTLPLWNETVDLALRVQRSLPTLASCGWDIAITDDGPILLEGNLNYDISILQIAHQKGLRKELSAALDGFECPRG